MSSRGKVKSKKNQEKATSISNKDDRTVSQQVSDFIMRALAALYVIAMLCIFPLYMEKKYLNMGEAKYHFFIVVSASFLGAMLLAVIFWAISHRGTQVIKEKLSDYSVTDWFAFAFLLASFFSYLFAEDKELALMGYTGWYMGLFAQTIFIVSYFFVSRFWEWSPFTINFALLTGAVVYGIAVLQRFSLDIFRLYDNIQADGSYKRLSPEYIEKFVSTVGQTSWYSSYAVLILPFGMFWYYNDTKIWSRVLSGIFVVLGAASICTVNNDSAYVALALIMMVFFWFAIEDNAKFLRFLEICLMFLATFKVIGILQDMFPERMIELITGTEATTNFLNHSPVMVILLIAVAIFYTFLKVIIGKYTDERTGDCKIQVSNYKGIRKILIYLAILCVWGVILMIILTTQKKLPAFMSGLYNVGALNFDNYWGNHRGFNWRMSMKAIGTFSFKDMFFGVGPDCFSYVMDKFFYTEVREFWKGKQLACAHCEWLNMFVNEGLVGLTAYAGIFISMCVRLGKTVKDEPMAMPCLAAVCAYMGYNLFCYQQSVCTPTIFVLMGIGEMIIMYSRRTKEKNSKTKEA